MSTTGAAPLNLTKPESTDVVDLAVINTNYDTINTFAANTNTDLTTKAGQISTLNTAVGAAGTVQNAVKATNVAGGSVGRIPIQSAADTTVFVANAAAGGKVLYSQPTSPYAAWSDPVPYKIASGKINPADWSSGAVTVTFSGVSFNVAPLVVLTPYGTNNNVSPTVTLTSVSTSGFSALSRSITVSGGTTTIADSAPTVHWVAIQYSSSQAGSQ